MESQITKPDWHSRLLRFFDSAAYNKMTLGELVAAGFEIEAYPDIPRLYIVTRPDCNCFLDYQESTVRFFPSRFDLLEYLGLLSELYR